MRIVAGSVVLAFLFAALSPVRPAAAEDMLRVAR